jgi:hypothetical protein
VIRHATATAAIFALPVTMILAALRTLLVAAVGLAQLILAGGLSATLAAIALPAVAGATNKKHRSTTLSSTEQLS